MLNSNAIGRECKSKRDREESEKVKELYSYKKIYRNVELALQEQSWLREGGKLKVST